MKVDRAADAVGNLLPRPSAVGRDDEAEIAAARGVAARIEDRGIVRIRCESHEVVASAGQPFCLAVRRDDNEAVGRGESARGGGHHRDKSLARGHSDSAIHFL